MSNYVVQYFWNICLNVYEGYVITSKEKALNSTLRIQLTEK